MRPKLTYANVMATVAVFIALGGSAYATITITGRNVKNRSLTAKDIKKNSLTTREVRNGALLARDFAAGQLPAGPPGPKGDKGDRGATGLTGQTGQTGAPGTARAYGAVTDCLLPNNFCAVHENKGIAYVVRVGTGRYCVGVNGITPADSVAIVSVAENSQGVSDEVVWRRNNLNCVATEFEVETYNHGQVAAVANGGSGTVIAQAPSAYSSGVSFAIAIP